MRTFPLSDYLIAVRGFQEMVSTTEPGDLLGEEVRRDNTKALRNLARDARKYGLTFTASHYERMADSCERGASHWDLAQMSTELLNRLEDECGDRLMLMADSEYIKYIDEATLFDSKDPKANKVSVAFPSAAEDIAESGVCLAFGRSTACVMHLARVLEVGLQALAKALNVTKQNDWGAYLRKIDANLDSRLKASGARTADEQFFAEARTCFDDMRRAWRNPTMHVDRVYKTERAEEILISVRSFMRHLATKLHE